MRLLVTVKTGAKKEKVEKLDSNSFRIEVRALPIDGKANKAIIKVLANYLGTAQSNLIIKSGQRSKKKIVEIK